MADTVQLVTGIIGLVIGILVLTALGVTVITQTDTGACGVASPSFNRTLCALENSSDTGKTMYSLIELLYPIMGVLFIIGVGFAIKDKY